MSPILVPGDSPTGHEAAGGDREATPRGRVWLCTRRVVSSLPAYPRSRARGVLVFGGVGLPRRRVCHERRPVRICGPCVSRGWEWQDEKGPRGHVKRDPLSNLWVSNSEFGH